MAKRSLIPEERFVNRGLEGMEITLPNGEKWDEEKEREFVKQKPIRDRIQKVNDEMSRQK